MTTEHKIPAPPDPLPDSSSTSWLHAIGLAVTSLLGLTTLSLGVAVMLQDGGQESRQQSPPSSSSPSSSSSIPESAMSEADAPTETPSMQDGVPHQPATSPEGVASGHGKQNSNGETNKKDNETRPLDPVRAMSNTFVLPHPSLGTQPTILVDLDLDDHEQKILQINLDEALSDAWNTFLKSAEGEWKVMVAEAGSLGQDRHDATFRVTDEGLLFNWEVASPSRSIAFCPLKITIGDDSETCQLFKPFILKPVNLQFDQPTHYVSIGTGSTLLPDAQSLRLKIAAEGFGPNVQFDRENTVRVNEPFVIAVVDPVIPEPPLLTVEVTLRPTQKDSFQLEIASFMHFTWVGDTGEPEVVKLPFELARFPTLQVEKERIRQRLTRKIETDIERELSTLQARQNDRLNESPLIQRRMKDLKIKRDRYLDALQTIDDVDVLEGILRDESSRLADQASLKMTILAESATNDPVVVATTQ